MIITTDIDANVARANLFNPLIIAEDDENSHRIVAKIMFNDEQLIISNALLNKMLLCYERAEGYKAVIQGTVTSGLLSFDLPDDMFLLDDIVKCDIVLSFSKQVKRHTMTLDGDNLIVTERTVTTDCPLRTGLFYIDSQWRVMTETNMNGGSL